MTRFHVSISVADIGRSTEFYNSLFGAEPTILKDDYAKWMLEDPRVNFSISESKKASGVSHIGLQVDTMEELEAIQSRLYEAEERTYTQPEAQCCYARSSKTWVSDPDNVTWETFVTHEQIMQYGDDRAPADAVSSGEACCG